MANLVKIRYDLYLHHYDKRAILQSCMVEKCCVFNRNQGLTDIKLLTKLESLFRRIVNCRMSIHNSIKLTLNKG